MIAKNRFVLRHLVPTLMPQRLKILKFEKLLKAAILPVINSTFFYLRVLRFKDFKRQPNHIYGSQLGIAAKVVEYVKRSFNQVQGFHVKLIGLISPYLKEGALVPSLVMPRRNW